uniref:Uncharacterized protein n=1 Tax=Tetradesmus obliquus TaxID=3088 RepID=A0A383W187_TETOB|eukprot:jgi/Sobl393_1/20047/SZX71437.1
MQRALQSATSSAGKEEQEQHLQAVLWLLRAARNAAAAVHASEHLVRLPALPLHWALHLVTAGVRITYAQLLAAACSTVPGVEVWVQAQQQLGVQTDMPAAAVAVCCGDIAAEALDTSRLSVKDAADLLQIAVNCSSQDTATALFESMARSQRTLDFKLLEPAAVRRILVTAALRQHASVIETLAMQAGVEQIVDPATFEAVLSHLMTQRHEDVCAWLLDTCATAAATLSSDAVARLILQALESGPKCQQHGSLVSKLICMPAAAQMSSSDMARIIQSIDWLGTLVWRVLTICWSQRSCTLVPAVECVSHATARHTNKLGRHADTCAPVSGQHMPTCPAADASGARFWRCKCCENGHMGPSGCTCCFLSSEWWQQLQAGFVAE